MPRKPQNRIEIREADLRRWRKNPPTKTTYIHDDHVRGLQVRRNPDGSITWFVRSSRLPGGKRPTATIGHYPGVGVRAARQAAIRIMAGVELGRLSGRQIVTWQEVKEIYIETALAAGNKSINQYEYIFGRLPASWNDRDATTIAWPEIRSFLIKLGSGAKGSPGTATKCHNMMRAAFNAAIAAEAIAKNPLEKKGVLFKAKTQVRCLDFDEIRRLWKAWDDLRDYGGQGLQLVLLTGCRRSEIHRARWDQIHGDILRIPDNKPGRYHEVLLAPLAQGIVDDMKWSQSHSEFVMPSPVDPRKPRPNLDTAVQKSRDTTGIRDWSAHKLRHTTASHWTGALGLESNVVKYMMNHVIPGITDSNYVERRRYQPRALEGWREWARLVSGIIAGRIGGDIIPISVAR